jgi:pimeloyl-ACP methyl ester carboxylesterase
MVRRATFGLVFVLIIAGLQGISAQAPAAAVAAAPAAKNDYGDGKSWLCRPGREDACTVDISTTVVAANGTLTTETFTANPNAPIDCFYLYPTVSLDATGNSDMNPGPEEKGVVRTQLARFASQCRVFAPMYRQFTLVALRAATTGKPIASDRTLAYADVLDAWQHYLANDNKGRGVVLIGHSQGSGMLAQLIRNEIDGKPVQKQLVSALLLGSNIAVPAGKDVGGAFQHVPLCRSASQTGCVISYVTFRSNIPPRARSPRARTRPRSAAARARCTPTCRTAAASSVRPPHRGPGSHRRRRSRRPTSAFPGC